MDINSYISEIELCEWYFSETYNTTTLYFAGPKIMLNDKHPEAEFVTITIEFPTDHPEACYVGVSYSPTKYDSEEDAYTDYDWTDIDIPYEDIEKLLEIAENNAMYMQKRQKYIVG